MVVEYFTEWCPKCLDTVHWIEEWEQKFEHVIFLRVDCDNLPRLAKSKKIRVVPTFHLLRKGVVVSRMS